MQATTGIREEFTNLSCYQLPCIQADLALKVNVSDLTSLMPQSGSSEDASLMPMLVDIQSKMRQLEGELSSSCVTTIPSSSSLLS